MKGVKITFDIHENPITKKFVASILGVDVKEMIDGYSSKEVREISKSFEDIAEMLDRKNAELNTPEMQYPSGKP